MRPNSIGGLIRHKRERIGLEQRQLAQKLCVSQACLSRWENGSRTVPCEVIPDIARCLGCPELVDYQLRECPLWSQFRKVVA